MGNNKSAVKDNDLGNVLSNFYTEEIPYRASFLNYFRIELPIWSETRECSISKAFHFKLKKDLVIKKILISRESTDDVINMLSVDKKLSHTNVRHVNEVFQTKTHYIITFNYFDGMNLNEYLLKKGKSLKIEQIKSMFREIVETLKYIHSCNIMLRNFDPTNILYDGKDILFVGFSKARFMITDKKKIKKKYTYVMNYSNPFYKAPEVLDQDYDQRADVWVLGIMLYQMLTGFLPYASTKAEDLIKKIKTEPVDINILKKKNIDQQVIDLILGMLEKDPKKRLTLIQILNNEWLSITIEKMGRKESTNILNNAGKIEMNYTVIDFLVEFIANKANMNDEIRNLKILFRQIDINCDGVITKDEMIDAIDTIGWDITFEHINAIFEKYDKNKTGELEFKEFVAAFLKRSSVEDENHLEEFFEFIDTDQTGYVEYEELQTAMGKVLDAVANKQDFITFSGADKRLTKSEFVKFMKHIINIQKKNQKATNKKNSGAISPIKKNSGVISPIKKNSKA